LASLIPAIRLDPTPESRRQSGRQRREKSNKEKGKIMKAKTINVVSPGLTLAALLLGLSGIERARADAFGGTPIWRTTGSMSTNRHVHTATKLPNGKVLIAGGSDGSTTLASAELYDPATGTWSGTGSMGAARHAHTATLLPNGKVLVSGGYNGGALSSAEGRYWPLAGATALRAAR
jgi:hypothetical protein